jgi:hypothetical protein
LNTKMLICKSQYIVVETILMEVIEENVPHGHGSA